MSISTGLNSSNKVNYELILGYKKVNLTILVWRSRQVPFTQNCGFVAPEYAIQLITI
jgi:hypothetical protein